MLVNIWGTRGSMPVSGSRYSRYGGDTSCIEVRADAGDQIILDAGSGLGALDRAGLDRDGQVPAKPPVIFLSHVHIDHIQGLPFFSGIYSGRAVIYGPPGTKAQIGRLFDGVFHPVESESLHNLEIIEISSGDQIKTGSIIVEAMATNHPGGCLAYKSGRMDRHLFTGRIMRFLLPRIRVPKESMPPCLTSWPGRTRFWLTAISARRSTFGMRAGATATWNSGLSHCGAKV